MNKQRVAGRENPGVMELEVKRQSLLKTLYILHLLCEQ